MLENHSAAKSSGALLPRDKNLAHAADSNAFDDDVAIHHRRLAGNGGCFVAWQPEVCCPLAVARPQKSNRLS